jgi:hypothetical protein
MKKYLIRILVLTMVLFSATAAMALFEIDKTYFYDSAFTVYGGWENLYCGGDFSGSGPTATYRMIDVLACSDGHTVDHYCQHKNADGTWSPVTCPY